MPTDSAENLIPYEGTPSLDISMDVESEGQEVVESPTLPTSQLETTHTTVESKDEDEEDSTGEDARGIAKANKQMHLAMLDTIAEKFDDLSHDRITKEELKKWLDKNPLYHEKADRSQRLKHEYRAFMADLPNSSNTTATPPTSAPTNIDEIVAQAVAKALEAKEQEKSSQTFSTTMNTFASSKGLKGENYDTFQKNVVALKQAHTTVPQDQILDMAFRATVPLKGIGVVLPTQAGISPQAATPVTDEVDLSQGAVFIDIPVSPNQFR